MSATSIPTLYRCAECNEPVAMENGQITRFCIHDQADVLAAAKTNLKGVGAVKTPSAQVKDADS